MFLGCGNVKDKKIIIIVVGIIVLISLATCLFFLFKNGDSDAIKFKNEYESLNNTIREKDGKKIRSIEISKNNPMIYSSEDEIVKMIENKETFLVYFGFADCPWCRSVLPNLLDSSIDLGLDKIYYVDVKEIRDIIEFKDGEMRTTKEGTDGYYKLLELLSDSLDDYTILDEDDKKISTGEKRIFAPNVVAIVDGKVEKMTDGISEKQTDGYMELTDEMNEESYNEFKCVIKCVTDSKQICSKEKAC